MPRHSDKAGPPLLILSTGINAMVKSIVNLSDRISAIIEMSGIPLAAFEYERSINRVFVTSGLSRLLGLSEKEAALLYQNAATPASCPYVSFMDLK